MNTVFKKGCALLENASVLTYSKRFRGKINIQKPKEPHYERAKALKLTEPYYPKKNKDKSMVELCGNIQPKLKDAKIDNPYQNILAKECLNWFNHCKFIALFHLNPLTAEERFKAYVMYRKQNMHLKVYGKETLKIALMNTRFEPFTQHYVSHNMLCFSQEPNVKQLLKISKRFPQMILLSGILEGKYVSRDEIIAYGQIPSLEAAQAHFVQVLQSSGGELHRRLTQAQNELVTQLEQRGTQLTDT